MELNIAELLARCVEQGASDLHLSAGLPPMTRLDGELRRLEWPPPDGGPRGAELPPLADRQVRGWLRDLMNDSQREHYAAALEADFAVERPGAGRFRVHAFCHGRGAGAVFRAIPARPPTLEELGLGQDFKDLALLPRGLVLVTGPTGSGKSTTLAALLDCVNRSRRGHILTVEDPIECIHRSERCLVSQREVHAHTRGFGAALRSALRADPDVIMVGELRDLDTIRLALRAAETGHLVFGTLHTQSAAKTIDRVVDVFPAAERALARSMLAESLQAVVSQALLKKAGGGRVAAREIMRGTAAVRNLIREDKVAQLYSAMQAGAAAGMQTLDQCLQGMLAQGLITREAARQQARDARNF